MTKSPGIQETGQHLREVAAVTLKVLSFRPAQGLQAVWDFRKMSDAIIWTEDCDQPKLLQGAFPMFFYESTVSLSQAVSVVWAAGSCALVN